MVIVDDHQLVSDGLGMLLDSEPDIEVCGYGRSVAEAIHLAQQADPDLVVMDFHLPDGTGLDAAIAIRRIRP
ncbi:MAG: response regulator transcription factor, partial [Chloroflexi bacterium]